MTKLVIKSLNARATKASRAGPNAPKKGRKTKSALPKPPRDSFAPVQAARTIDANSENFGSELQRAFLRNVRKARQENRRLLGYFDVAPRKV